MRQFDRRKQAHLFPRLQPDRRTLLALVLPSRPASTSKVSSSPSLRSSGSTPADCTALTCRNISGPPESSLMNPKPRSAFHIFKVPVAIALYFSFAFRPAHLDFGGIVAHAQFCRTAPHRY